MAKRTPRDIAQEVTNIIIERIESGTLPWRRPWTKNGASGCPLRYGGEPYTGINRLLLWAIGDAYGYRSRYWMTYRQASALGAQVRKGEKASPSLYYNTIKKDDGEEFRPDGEKPTVMRFMKAYSVFNADQIDGLPEHYYADDLPETQPTPSEHQDRIDAFFAPIPIEVRHGGGRAYYSITSDHVQMPEPSAFTSQDHYAATLGHELTHATGNPKRLDRQFGKRFGDKAYAFEELVADMGSGMICCELGLPAELHDSHASYIENWLTVLKNDKNAIITAAAKAEAAFAFLSQYSDHDGGCGGQTPRDQHNEKAGGEGDGIVATGVAA